MWAFLGQTLNPCICGVRSRGGLVTLCTRTLHLARRAAVAARGDCMLAVDEGRVRRGDVALQRLVSALIWALAHWAFALGQSTFFGSARNVGFCSRDSRSSVASGGVDAVKFCRRKGRLALLQLQSPWANGRQSPRKGLRRHARIRVEPRVRRREGFGCS